MTSFNKKNANLFPDFSMQVKRGLVSGWRSTEIEGRNPDIDFDVNFPFVDLWEFQTNFTLPNTESVMDLFSDNANDTLLGSGARKVTVFGLDANFDEIQEEVDMDGTNIVSTIQKFIRVFNVEVTDSGGSGENEGSITISDGSNNFGKILPGFNRSFNGHFTIPNDHNGYITMLDGSIGPSLGSLGVKEAELYLRIRKPNEQFIPEKVLYLTTRGSSNWQKNFKEPLFLEPRTDIIISARSNDHNVRMNSNLVLLLEAI